MALIRVSVLAGFPALRAGIVALLAAEPDLEVVPIDDDREIDLIVSTARSVPTADGPPAIVLVDSLAEATEMMRLARPPTGVLALTSEPEQLTAAIRAVAAGLAVIDPALRGSERERGLRARSTAGSDELTERERDVLALIADGHPNKAIAARLGISENTVKFHVAALLTKLGAASRTEAVTVAARRGLLVL